MRVVRRNKRWRLSQHFIRVDGDFLETKHRLPLGTIFCLRVTWSCFEVVQESLLGPFGLHASLLLGLLIPLYTHLIFIIYDFVHHSSTAIRQCAMN